MQANFTAKTQRVSNLLNKVTCWTIRIARINPLWHLAMQFPSLCSWWLLLALAVRASNPLYLTVTDGFTEVFLVYWLQKLVWIGIKLFIAEYDVTHIGESIRCFCNSLHSKNNIYCQIVKWLSRKSGILFFQVTRENIIFYNHLEFPISNPNLWQCRQEAHQLMGITDELCASCSKSGCIVILCTPVTRLSQTFCAPFLFLRPKHALAWAYSWGILGVQIALVGCKIQAP